MAEIRFPNLRFIYPGLPADATLNPARVKLQAMERAVQQIRRLALGREAPTFSWAGNIQEKQHDPDWAARLRMIFATSTVAETAPVGWSDQYSAQFDLKLNVIGPDQMQEFNVPILFRERSFADSGLEQYPVKPLWKRREDRSETPVPLGQLIAKKEELISTVPSVIEAVTFVPIPAAGAPEAERFESQFEFRISVRHATEFWVIKEDEELLRRPLIMSCAGGERRIQNIAEEEGREENRYFKADFVPNMTTAQADNTSLMRGHFIIIAIPIVGEKPPALPSSSWSSLLGTESMFMSLGGTATRGLEVGEVAIGSGDRSGMKSTLVDSTTRDPLLLPRIIHLKLLGVREGQDLPLGQDIAGALEFPPLPN